MVVVSGLESPVLFKHPSGHKPYFKCEENNRSHRRKRGCQIHQIITLPILAKLGYLKDSNAVAHSVDTGIR